MSKDTEIRFVTNRIIPYINTVITDLESFVKEIWNACNSLSTDEYFCIIGVRCRIDAKDVKFTTMTEDEHFTGFALVQNNNYSYNDVMTLIGRVNAADPKLYIMNIGHNVAATKPVILYKGVIESTQIYRGSQ